MKFATANADCISTTERDSKSLLNRWLIAADIDPADLPLDHHQTAHLLSTAGYAVDIDELCRLADLGQIPDVAMFDARDILAAAGALEGRRQWKATPTPHDEKKHPSRIALENLLQSGEAGIAAIRKSLEGMDLKYALLLLVEANSRELREKLHTNIEAMLILERAAIADE